MYEDYLEFVFGYLGIHGIILDLEPCTTEEWCQGDMAEAYCAELGSWGPIKVFEIEYLESLESDHVAFHKMIAHECVHIQQVLRGDTFNCDLPYDQQPHEIEAYTMQEEVYNAWLKQKY